MSNNNDNDFITALLILIVLLLMIFFIYNGLNHDVENFKIAEKTCIELGFDRINIRDSNECDKKINYNKKTGEYEHCYMPIEKNISAEEWCGDVI